MKRLAKAIAVGAITLAASFVWAQTFTSQSGGGAVANGQSTYNTTENTTPSTQPEPARTLGHQNASTQSDSVQRIPYCANGATNYPTCTITTTGTETQTVACPAPQTGSISQERTVTYINGVASSYGAWVTTSNTCVSPPVCGNGAPNYPICTFSCANGAANYPTCTFSCANGATDYPTCTAPNVCANGATNYPTCTFSCANGATNYPTCTVTNVCANGATNYPTCTFSCANGATNYPTCTFSCANGATNWPTCTFPVCTNSTSCEGANSVTRDSCTGGVVGIDYNAQACGGVSLTTATETQTTSCPAPSTGTIWQSRTNTFNWGVLVASSAWVETSRDCQSAPVDPLVTITVWGVNPCGAPYYANTVTVPQSQAGNYMTYEQAAAAGGWAACGL